MVLIISIYYAVHSRGSWGVSRAPGAPPPGFTRGAILQYYIVWVLGVGKSGAGVGNSGAWSLAKWKRSRAACFMQFYSILFNSIRFYVHVPIRFFKAPLNVHVPDTSLCHIVPYVTQVTVSHTSQCSSELIEQLTHRVC